MAKEFLDGVQSGRHALGASGGLRSSRLPVVRCSLLGV